MSTARPLYLVCAAVAALFWSGPAVAQLSEADRSELLELNRRIAVQNIEEQNPALLQEVALNEFTVVAPGGRVENLSQAIAGVGSFSSDATITVSDQLIVTRGRTAVVIAKLAIDGEMQPVGELPPIKSMTVYVEEDGRWRLLARSLTPCFEIAIERGVC